MKMETSTFKGITKRISAKNKAKTVSIALILLLSFSTLMTILPNVNAQTVPNRKTYSYISVNPPVIGRGQMLLVNLWIFPPPEDAQLYAQGNGYRFTGITITFTKPDGTTDSFKPVEGHTNLAPGETDRLGTIWFNYYPDQVGNWSIKIDYPGETLSSGTGAVYYQPSSSPSTKLIVQQDPVQLGELAAPLPTQFWTHPINANNREWYQISGDWLQPYYDGYGTFGGTAFNPYSKAINSPHIVWTKEVSMGGIIGGDWGSLSYGAGGGAPSIIMDGNLYYNIAGSRFRCVDLRTGEVQWEMPGTITLGQHLRAAAGSTTQEQTETTTATAYLWGLETTVWRQYNAFDGTSVRNITNVPAGASGKARFEDGNEIVYALQYSGFNATTEKLAIDNLIKWNLTKVSTTSNDWSTGIVWNVSLRTSAGWAPGDGRGNPTIHNVGDIAVLAAQNNEDHWLAIDLNTGALLWTKSVDYIPISLTSYGRNPNGPFLVYDSSMTLYAYDFKTGNELWRTVVGEYPWGVDIQRAGVIQAYGNVYLGSYDGHIYALDLATGKLLFKSDISGTTSETPYGTWAFYQSFGGADGKIYASTSEHSPTQPRIRGNMLLCFDAYTGKELWNTSMAAGALSIADGYLVGVSENDGIMYNFGKGQTATTVSAPMTTVTAGTGALIQGNVMDQSPAQPGTPAVSDADMSMWMQYLHQQNATLLSSPPAPHGVQVELRAMGSDGSLNDLGTVTTDSSGHFAKAWSPTAAGLYTIYAAFPGSDSYWSSSAETSISVGPTMVTATQQTAVSATTSDVMMSTLIAAIAIIIAIAIVGFLLLRKK